MTAKVKLLKSIIYQYEDLSGADFSNADPKGFDFKVLNFTGGSINGISPENINEKINAGNF